ncbi:hypothetical protein ONR75_18610 [Rhodopseudomonas sp. P2A-2r]|uniref:hypothetical protein n=1 Tax=Rhodopseudomonas sp. P2A-2r TaxID=2991972 RepID=UPI002234383C|nr:hypothetical protein [Rhodopseudomonas sp. P2A-2r]UZE47017.1 hypothetical protein ONR75_18610 [Rhodopseudomonas sp. P2A-2r]
MRKIIVALAAIATIATARAYPVYEKRDDGTVHFMALSPGDQLHQREAAEGITRMTGPCRERFDRLAASVDVMSYEDVTTYANGTIIVLFSGPDSLKVSLVCASEIEGTTLALSTDRGGEPSPLFYTLALNAGQSVFGRKAAVNENAMRACIRKARAKVNMVDIGTLGCWAGRFENSITFHSTNER